MATREAEPTVLLVDSAAAPVEAVRSVAAALQASGAHVDRLTVGHGGRVMRFLLALPDRAKIERTVRELAPDVAVSFDPDSAEALVAARDALLEGAAGGTGAVPTPVVAVVPDLEPTDAWRVGADRFVVHDEAAAVTLASLGNDAARIGVMAPPVSLSRVQASSASRESLRQEFGLPADTPVVLVDASELDSDRLSLVAAQLAFASDAPMVFDAGPEASHAQWLRRQIPAMGIRAKMFGRTDNAGRYWRAADIALIAPRAAAIHRAIAAGLAIVCLPPENDAEAAHARALAERDVARVADSPLTVPIELTAWTNDKDAMRKAGEAMTSRGGDGAYQIAELVRRVARHRVDVLAETYADSRQRRDAPPPDFGATDTPRPRSRAPASDLEDLSGSGPPPDSRWAKRVARARAEVDDAREAADKWMQRARLAADRGDDTMAADARREAERKQARMHQALSELGRLEREKQHMNRQGPADTSLDDMLADVKRRAAKETRTIDDELAALKRRAGETRS